ncbi:hypothetical protein [Streptomyces sp. NBC_01508]|uniref:hypothetical protein n=1 Tax=Streptomyces sp. NBC_01508 TaxID=2903888 RepID=UPI00386E8004
MKRPKLDDQAMRDLVGEPDRLNPPELRDCATAGTDITPDDPRSLFHGSVRPVRTPAISAAELVVQKRSTPRQMACTGRSHERRPTNRYGENDGRIPMVAPSPHRRYRTTPGRPPRSC